MEDIYNSLWKQTLREEAITVPVHARRSGNSWKKGTLSLGAIALILTMAGVPVCGIVLRAESSVIPLNHSNVGVSVNVPGVNNALAGDII